MRKHKVNTAVRLVGLSLVGLYLVGAAAADQLSWTGGGDGFSAYDEANWQLSSTLNPPPAGTIDPGVPVNNSIELRDTPVNVDASQGPLTLGPAGLLQVVGGALITNDFIRRDQTPEIDNFIKSVLFISDSDQQTANVAARGLQEIDVSLVGNLILTGAQNPLQFSVVVFSTTDQANSSLILTNQTVEDVVDDHLTKLKVGGPSIDAVVGTNPAVQEPGDNLLITPSGAMGSIITPITEPFNFLPGDADNDGDVDDSDIGTAFANFTGPVGAAGGKFKSQGDADGDGDVDDSDLGSVFANFTGPLNHSTGAVPEPSVSVLMVGAMALTFRKRRRG